MKLSIAAFFISILAITAHAAEPFTGQFLYKYEGGNVYRVTVHDAKSMSWLCVEGAEKGATGMEKPERFEVADKIYFVTWTEKTGIQVSQAINLKTMKVYSTIIEGKDRYVVTGDIVREK